MWNVLLVESNTKCTVLEDGLKNFGCKVQIIQYTPSLVSQALEISPEILIINLDTPSEKIISELHTLDLQLPLPVIVFAKQCSHDIINKLIKVEISALVINGAPYHHLDSVIQVAMARFRQRQATRQVLDDVRAQLEDRKQIERAKAILIKTQHFTEDEAYHKLRKLAMDRKISLGEMARNVIAMAQLLN